MIDTGVPLGVRVYDIKDGVDRHLTKWVDDFSFRHTAPGGCASSVIKFRVPNIPNVDPLMFGNLYYRVQIYDCRDAEVLWEGRVEDPATQVEENAWELGILGGQKATTDVKVPVLYVDNTIANWRRSFEVDEIEVNPNEANQVIAGKLKSGYTWSAGQEIDVLNYNGGWACHSGFARISATYKGTGPGAQGGNFEMVTATTAQPAGFDVTALNTAGVYKSNLIGTDLTGGVEQDINFAIRRKTGVGSYLIGASEEGLFWLKWPKVVGIRMDENGNTLLAAGDYPGDYVYVHQIVRDVVARYLSGGWWAGTLNQWDSVSAASKSRWAFPEQGSIRGYDAFIDASDVNKITNLWWNSAVDAKEILDTMMLVQSNAYWAVWPSGHRFGQDTSDDILVREHQFRFAWAKWPISWNYLVSSEDGMEEQISGDQLFNGTTLSYETPEQIITTGTWYGTPTFGVSITGKINWQVEELENRFTRKYHFEYPGSDPDITADDFDDYMRQQMVNTQEPKNVGTITIRRAIPMIDDGSSDGNGFAGMVQPWELRPGKLVKIKDIMPTANSSEMQWDSGFGRVLNTNTGFEAGTTAGWAINFGTFTAATDRVYTGTRSGKMVPTGAAVNCFVNCAVQPVSPGFQYRVSAWAQCDVARSVSLEIHWYTSASVLITTTPLVYSMPADQWRFLEVVGTAPPTAAFGAMLIGMSSTPPASNILWFDEGRFELLMGFPKGHENCMFRVAATEYSTSNNSCKLELDELPRWDLSTQIVQDDAPGNLRVR